MVYFSPRLEDESYDLVVAVVAHELAHIALNHKVAPLPQEYDLQEKEVFDSLSKWGFKKEIKQHRISLRARGMK